MAERDAFESRLRAALLRHVADGPTDFDALGFARTVAAQEPRRHGFAAALSLRGLAIPRLAWLLLLAGLLLVALVGGTLLVGSQIQRRLPAVVPPVGQVFVCPPGSSPDEPGPVDQVRPPFSYGLAMAFDRHAGRLLALAQTDNDLQTWTFDVCTNTWTRMHPNQEPPPGTGGQLVYDVDSGVTIASDGARMWAYDYEANTWTEKGVATAFLFAYDPLSGLVVAQGGRDPSVPLSTYDVETDTWTPIREANGGPGPEEGISPTGWTWYGVLAYDASVDRIVASVGAETWLFDLRTGRWSRSGAEAPDVIEVFAVSPTIVYDEAAKRTVLVGDVPRLAAYDATADRWETLAEYDLERAAGFQLNAVYDPVNRRLVGWHPSHMHQDDLFAFDLVTREWTVLLAASAGHEGRPLPSPEATLRP